MALGLYYDGSQLYKSKVVSFWPLLVTILNLPPKLRKMYGAGIFMVGLFQSKTGSAVEDFLIRDFLIQDLHFLASGFEYKDVITNKIYFIQVSYILYIQIIFNFSFL